MTHTLESLMRLSRRCEQRYLDSFTNEAPRKDDRLHAALEAERNGLEAALAEVLAERDTLQSKCDEQAREIERLTGCLKKANDNHEEFERRWYLACQERDQLQTCVSEWVAANGPLGWISELRAKVAEMEKQEPIGYVFDDDENIYTGSVIRRNQIDGYVPVYLASGAAPDMTRDHYWSKVDARCKELESQLINCRPSVKNDLNNFDRFMLRKYDGRTPNDGDAAELARLIALLDYIDSLAPGAAPKPCAYFSTKGFVCNKCGQDHDDPIAQAAPAAQPLTDDQIDAIRKQVWLTRDSTLVDFARAIERAHGIGKEQQA